MAIKINKDLIKHADFDPTKESQPIPLKTLCEYIYSNKMTLPIFQTYIRWTVDKSIDLLNFQLSGKAAVSPISINRIEKQDLAVPQISFIERTLLDKDKVSYIGKYSVNDGQQRLTCNYKAYTDHDDFKDIVLDITTGKFELKNKELKKSQIPVGKLYHKDHTELENFISNNKHLQTYEVITLLMKIRNKFMSYYYTVNFANDLTQEEQLQWFDVLNLAGSRVTGVEVQLTNMLVEGVDFYGEYSYKFIEILDDFNFKSLIIRKDTEISIPLAALNPAYELITNRPHSTNFSPIPSDVKAIAISKLDPDDLRSIFTTTLEALKMALNFIYDMELEPDRIDYITYLTGLFVYNENRDLNPIQTKEVIKWFSETIFTDLGNKQRREIFDKLILFTNLSE